jgi:Tol biopolymer transport system component
MIGDTILHGHKRLAAAGLLCAVLGGTGSCGDSVGVDGHDDTGPAALIVSDPLTPSAPTAPSALAASVALSVTYVSLPPGTIPNGVAATISNRRTSAGLTVALVDGGLDPVPIAAEAGDTLAFAVDLGASAPERFVRVVPNFLKIGVVRTEPPAGKRDVPLNMRVRIVFSEPVDPTSVTGATLGLQQDGAPVSGGVSVSSDGLEAIFQPAADLLPETGYTIAVGDNIRDTDGSQLASPVTAGFTTGLASGLAVGLRFDRQPVNTITGLVMSTGVTVIAVDASGNPATGFTGSIHLAIASNPGGGVLSGTTTRVGGPSAVFNDLRIDGAGNEYTLVATASGLSSATSSAFDIVDVGPAQGVIAFYSYGQGILTTSDHGGGTGLLVPDLAAGVGSVAQPAWAPDGKRLAFTEYLGGFGPGYGGIFVVNANGSGVTSLGQEGFSPAWSPDGSRIAFASVRDGNAEIYLMSAQGTGIVRLTNDPAADYDPAWSPDGTKLAFTRSTAGESVIYVMYADGSGVSRLQSGSYPAWSPDGTRIAFSRLVTNPYIGDIYVMSTDGSGVTKLTSNPSPANSYHPTWSPDGRRIAFSSTPDPDWIPDSIYAMNADGSGVVLVHPSSLTGEMRASLYPAWSPQ